MKAADVIIIGGGIIGCALFYELAKNYSNKIILLEQDHIASRTTGQSGGFIRKLNLDSYLCQLSAESFDYYLSFTKKVGQPCGFTKIGVTYTIPEQLLVLMQSNINKLIDNSYPIEIKTTANNISLIHEHNAGYIDTTLTCKSWVTAALKNNALVYEHCPVLSILCQDGKVQGVKTPQGIIEAQSIIVATGADGYPFLPFFDFNSSISIKSFQYHLYTQSSPCINTAHINLLEGWYLFPQKKRQFIAGYINRDKEIKTKRRNEFLDKSEAYFLHNLLCKHFPWLTNKPYIIKKSYDAYTSDDRGLINKSEIKGLIYATGLSSGGIKIAPAFAKRVIQLLDI